jgi:hypothetical protein
MVQFTVSRRHLVVFTAVVAMVVSVGWVGVASRASAASATPVVYVATGENFPDALGAASAAAVQGGPVLLVTKTAIPAETKAELTRLAPDVIYVAGGTAVVSDTVFNQLKAYAPTVTRVAGANRYSTAVEVSKSAFPITGGGGDLTALQAQVAALSAEVDALQATLSGVTRNGSTLLFTGMNLQIVNGTGSTDGDPNSLGNVIIGYNEDIDDAAPRTGSHYLIVGYDNDWTSYGGIVAGVTNTASGPYSSASGGRRNTASGLWASVSGGSGNTASGNYSSVTGGHDNTASDYYSSVSGGFNNTASGDHTSVSGGAANTASGLFASVSGGENNTATGQSASILGGDTRGVSGTNGTYPYCGCGS